MDLGHHFETKPSIPIYMGIFPHVALKFKAYKW